MLTPNQFQVNEAWIVFKLNDEPLNLAEGQFNMYVVMDSGSTYVFGQLFAKLPSSSPAPSDIEDIFKKVFAEAKTWPSKLIVASNIPENNNFTKVAKRHGIVVQRVPESKLYSFINPVKESIPSAIFGESSSVRIETHEVTDDILRNANVDLSNGELSAKDSDAIGKSFLNEYYKNWLDESIPGLNGMTPREASKSPEGVELLNKLFEHMEGLNVPENMRPNISALRRELGID